MVDRPRTIYNSKNGIYQRREWGEIEVSQNDTITLPEYDDATTLWMFSLYKLSDGSAVTSTKALNVATVTAAVTNTKCLYIAYGVKA